jgi:ribosome maturation factor RimP
MGPAERVHELVEPLLAPLGLELVDVELQGAVLRVSIDRPEGVDLEIIGRASSVVSEALDDDDPIPGRYTLEVSSPGLERPLRTPDHFRRFVGTTISVKTNPDVEGDRRFTGRLEAADADGVTVDGRTLSYDQIAKARTVFEWGPTPKQGGATPRTKKSAGKKSAGTKSATTTSAAKPEKKKAVSR